jgi:hypothetical protein
MTNVIPVAGRGDGWTEWELQELADLQRTLDERGLPTYYEHGIADEGAPWVSFFDERDGSFVAHIARDRANYLLICSDKTLERSPILTRVLDVVRDRCKHAPFAPDWLPSR